MTPKAQKLYAVVRNIRSCFHQLKVLADELHQDLDVTASMRAVMECLAEDGKQTVPQVARSKRVSRQHIQVNVDALMHCAFVVLKDNPGHRRSPFVSLTKQGWTAFENMRRREQPVLEQLAVGLSMTRLDDTLNTLTVLKESIFHISQEGTEHDEL